MKKTGTFLKNDSEVNFFLKARWRNKQYKFRPPSVPKQIPFIYSSQNPKQSSLYEMIQEQNRKENEMLEDTFQQKDIIITNIRKNLGKSEEKYEGTPLRNKKFRFKARNIDINDLNQIDNHQLEAKSADYSENSKNSKQKQLSYSSILQNINDEIHSAREIEQELQKKRFFRRNNANSLISQKRKEEEIKIKQILSKIKINHIENAKFHEDLRQKFDKFRENRIEIDKNFAVIAEKLHLKNFELVKRLEKMLKNKTSPCSHENSLKTKNENFEKDEKTQKIQVFEKLKEKLPTNPPKKTENFQKNFNFKDNGNALSLSEYFFSIRMQKIDSKKIRLFLKIEEKEINFVLSDNSENFLKLDIKEPEFVYYGNDSHDTQLLLDIENKLLQDLKLQKQKNECFFKKMKDFKIKEESYPKTPSFKNRENGENNDNFDSRNAFEIFLNIKQKGEIFKNEDISCNICKSFNDLLIDFMMEIYTIDFDSDDEIMKIDDIFKDFLKDFDDNISQINEYMKKFGECFRSCLNSGFGVLPNHCIFFEKIMKIILFLNEVSSIKAEETISLLQAEILQ